MYLPSGNNFISGSGMSSSNTWIISTTAKTITTKWITEASDPYNDALNDSISVFFMVMIIIVICICGCFFCASRE